MSGDKEVLRVPGSGRDTQDSEPAVNLTSTVSESLQRWADPPPGKAPSRSDSKTSPTLLSELDSRE